ncbi:MAG TPA: hypothetical protein VIU43_06220, partial [Nitrosospira sp.]
IADARSNHNLKLVNGVVALQNLKLVNGALAPRGVARETRRSRAVTPILPQCARGEIDINHFASPPPFGGGARGEGEFS